MEVGSIWQLFFFVARTVHFSIEVSCFVGSLIVSNCMTFFLVSYQAASTLFSLLNVLLEDFCVFSSDLFVALSYVGYFFQKSVESVYGIFYFFTYLGSLYYFVRAIGSFVVNSITSVFNVFLGLVQLILDVYILFRNTAFLVGLSVWDIVTSVPEYAYFFVYNCVQKGVEGVNLVNMYILQHVLTVVYEPHIILLFLYNVVKSCVSQFPFKPLCGLSIAVSLICIVLKKRRSLLNFACRTWLSVTTQSQQVVVSAWQTFEGYVLWLLTNQRRDWQRIPLNERFNDAMFDETETDSASEAADSDITNPTPQSTPRKRGAKDNRSENISEEMDTRLCVVCQDKTRSILTLPCRHVCLCSTCCTAVRAHQGLCPLCRQEISFAGRVYL